ncbi:MAG: purine-binding chemotaxis protein CheW [Epsilonproteobacteria bacterium]|nr:purine-binding chemotaxis protein CheW [Campylobacterota bacterium]
MSDNPLNQVLKRQENQSKNLNNEQEHEFESENIVQLVGFIVGEEEFAIPILNIQEIIKPIEYTRVPGVPEYVMGVFNLRGNVIPLIDLRRKFGIPPAEQTPETRYIVMKHEDNIVGFIIDKLTEAIRMNADKIDPPPENLQKEKGMVQGIGKREDNIITILKVDALLKRDF